MTSVHARTTHALLLHISHMHMPTWVNLPTVQYHNQVLFKILLYGHGVSIGLVCGTPLIIEKYYYTALYRLFFFCQLRTIKQNSNKGKSCLAFQGYAVFAIFSLQCALNDIDAYTQLLRQSLLVLHVC